MKASQAACKGKRQKHGTEVEDLPVGKLCHVSVGFVFISVNLF